MGDVTARDERAATLRPLLALEGQTEQIADAVLALLASSPALQAVAVKACAEPRNVLGGYLFLLSPAVAELLDKEGARDGRDTD